MQDHYHAEKVVWSVIQEDAMGVLECSVSLKPDTTHVTSKGATFFPLKWSMVFHLKRCVPAAGCSVVLSQQHGSELNQSRGLLVSEGEINHILQKHPSVLNSPVDRWLSVSGNI